MKVNIYYWAWSGKIEIGDGENFEIKKEEGLINVGKSQVHDRLVYMIE